MPPNSKKITQRMLKEDSKDGVELIFMGDDDNSVKAKNVIDLSTLTSLSLAHLLQRHPFSLIHYSSSPRSVGPFLHDDIFVPTFELHKFCNHFTVK